MSGKNEQAEAGWDRLPQMKRLVSSKSTWPHAKHKLVTIESSAEGNNYGAWSLKLKVKSSKILTNNINNSF